MSFTDDLLDISWTLQFMPGVRRNFKKLDTLLSAANKRRVSKEHFNQLANELQDHLVSRRDNEPKDELNDQTTRQGRMTKCSVRPVQFTSVIAEDKEPSGLLIEAGYQLTTYRLIILRVRAHYNGTQDLALVFCKGNQKFLNHIKDWLDNTFDLPPAEGLHLASYTLLQVFSEFVNTISHAWPSVADRTDALRLVMLAQAIGSVKVTITIAASDNDLTDKLRSFDVDIPSDTINELIGDSPGLNPDSRSAGNAALQGLRNGIHNKIGLKLPLYTDQAGNDQLEEAACKISKIACASFAISTEGRLKFSGKPIEQADLRGYQEDTIRIGMARIIELLFEGAGSRLRGPQEADT